MIPRPIYEILPVLYVVFGLLSTAGLDPTYGRAAGVLLIIAGGVIYAMRREYRKRHHATR